MADEWRRYLAQQIELGWRGGNSRAETRTGGDSRTQRSAMNGVQPPGARSSPRTDISQPSEQLQTSDEPKWRKGAPPIPGPGLRGRDSARAGLLGNDLSSLSTLEAVAERIRTTSLLRLCAETAPMRCRVRAILAPGWCSLAKGPGATEDATGRPFVGQAGKLLDDILEAIDVPRTTVYITNIVKCRPPQNRKPLPDEIAACIPYLHRQIDADPTEGDPRARRDRRRGDARRAEEPRRAPRQGAHATTAFRWS